jgi:MFS family permease
MEQLSMLARGESKVDQSGFSKGYRAWFLGLMVTTGAVAVIDRTAVLTLAQPIKAALHISDAQFGLITGFGIAVCYALFGLPLARLADTTNRMRLVSVAIGLFSAFSALCGLAASFIHLFLCRVIVGLGEAGVQPPTISAISDLYPPQKRGTALSILSINLAAGTLIGPIAAGYLAEAYSWRIVFYLVGGVGIVLALLAWFTLREPPRGMSEGGGAEHEAAPGFFAVLKFLAAKRSFWQVVAGMGVTNFAAAGVGAFLPLYFSRQFNLGPALTGDLFGGISFLSMLGGTCSGGVIVDFISKRDGRWYVWLPAVGLVVAAPLYVGAFTLPSPVAAMISLTFAGAALFLYYAPTQALLQNMVEPRMRGTAAYVFFLVTGLVGFGGGPPLLGLISDRIAAHAFTAGQYLTACPGGAAPHGAAAAAATACRVASASGLGLAMSVMSCLYLWSAVHFVLASRTVRTDVRAAS